jgi:hypothetical protein
MDHWCLRPFLVDPFPCRNVSNFYYLTIGIVWMRFGFPCWNVSNFYYLTIGIIWMRFDTRVGGDDICSRMGFSNNPTTTCDVCIQQTMRRIPNRQVLNKHFTAKIGHRSWFILLWFLKFITSLLSTRWWEVRFDARVGGDDIPSCCNPFSTFNQCCLGITFLSRTCPS